ncbi:hypothetical protein [Streptomyces sp. VRA16 Mangrove soil]|uniref:hypothetical protein n=1 Tax=Streptomyces sp. VRA16 Mangrove soil TaxID=2817434 RepID=UPI001A9D18F3|nr:hypothetical protein [Streptomyces sp. VRA16 Mangrove soil]MBO1334833.1 hypothetical protein [Streptomyces sp. VRA16 Mangrove soil]
MVVLHGKGAYVAHAETDVYGPGKVLGVDGELRRVRFVYFVATVGVGVLRPADASEEAWVRAWIAERRQRYGDGW